MPLFVFPYLDLLLYNILFTCLEVPYSEFDLSLVPAAISSISVRAVSLDEFSKFRDIAQNGKCFDHDRSYLCTNDCEFLSTNRNR